MLRTDLLIKLVWQVVIAAPLSSELADIRDNPDVTHEMSTYEISLLRATTLAMRQLEDSTPVSEHLGVIKQQSDIVNKFSSVVGGES